MVNAGTAWYKRSPDQTQIRTWPGFALSCRASKGEYLDGSRVSKRRFLETALANWRLGTGRFRELALPARSRCWTVVPLAITAGESPVLSQKDDLEVSIRQRRALPDEEGQETRPDGTFTEPSTNGRHIPSGPAFSCLSGIELQRAIVR